MDPLEQIHQALCPDNPELFRSALAAHPELRARVNNPIGPFDSPIVDSPEPHVPLVLRERF